VTLKQYRALFHHHLSEVYKSEEIDSFFFMTTQQFLSYNRADTIWHLEKEITIPEADKFNAVIERLRNSEPIQYILGETEFYGLSIFVNSATLIPRPETEELVDWILQDECLSALSVNSVLDIGTGSGCIAIAIAKHRVHASVHGWDISQEALEVAQKNALYNKVKVGFERVDILNLERCQQRFDIIVSNPPYVRELEKKKMQKNVLEFEPHSALFVSDLDPLVFYRKIASLAKRCLTPNGVLYFEINEYLGKELVQLLHEAGFTDIALKKDFFGKDRMIRCCLG
jgi:release factor glutamine methyltransferase